MSYGNKNSAYIKQTESIIGVKWSQENPNHRVHRSSGKRGFHITVFLDKYMLFGYISTNIRQIYPILVIFRLTSVFEMTAMLNWPIYSFFAKSDRVTD